MRKLRPPPSGQCLAEPQTLCACAVSLSPPEPLAAAGPAATACVRSACVRRACVHTCVRAVNSPGTAASPSAPAPRRPGRRPPPAPPPPTGRTMAKVEQVLSLEPQHELKFRGKRAAGPGAVTQRPAPEGTRPEGRTLSAGGPHAPGA